MSERLDEFHPHLLVKASADLQADIEGLIADLRRFAERVRGRPLTQSEADAFGHRASALLVRIKNRAADDAD